MKQPRNNPSESSQKTKLTIVLVLMGIGILLLIGLVVFAFRESLPSLSFLKKQQPFPTIIVPTPDCGSPILVVGQNTFQIQNVTRAADGTVNIPPDVSGVAYSTGGAEQQNTFLLSPTSDNVAFVTGLPDGTTAKVTLSNCNSKSFTLSAPQPGNINQSLQNQSTDSIIIFVQTDATGNGLMASGGVTEEEISTFNTPDPASLQAEIGLLETTPSSDGTVLQFKVSVYNFGTNTLTLTPNDVSLTPTGGSPLALTNSKPSLPREIAPGKTLEFTFTFPRPTIPTATLNVLTVEYDVEGY